MAVVDYSKFQKGLSWLDFQVEYKKQYYKDNGKSFDTNDKSTFNTMSSDYKDYSSKEPTANEGKTTDSNPSMGMLQGFARSLIQSGQGNASFSDYKTEKVGIEDAMNIALDKTTGKLKTLGEMAKGVAQSALNGVGDVFKQQSDLLVKINSETGIAGELSKGFRQEIMEASDYSARLGISFAELGKGMSDLLTDAGRFKIVSTETINQLQSTSKAFFDSVSEGARAANAMQAVSLGVADAARELDKAGHSSLELGLNAKQTAATLVQNIDKLNQYGFKNGIEGLTAMVQKSQTLKMNMEDVFRIAENVMDPQKAMELTANLSILGRAAGDLADPMKLLYDSVNDTGALQDAVAKSAEGLATFDRESGRFVVVGQNLRAAKDAANALGMSMKDYTNLAVQAAQRTSALSDLASAGLTFKDDKDKEFLTNLAQMKDGKMVIEVPKNLQEQLGGSTVALESMTEAQKETLLAQREAFKKMSNEEIIENQATAVMNIERNMSFIAARARIEMGKRGEQLATALGYDPVEVVKQTKGLADKVKKGEVTFSDEIGKAINKYIKTDNNQKSNITSEAQAKDTKTANKKKEDEKTINSDQTTKKVDVTLNVKSSDPLTDNLSRSIFNDPVFLSQVKESYLNMDSN